ncbi:ABC transporter ATP-binding protein [Legionella yabuuchiae]|uniref:ABC transporter transmembrane domain-containing protein n=1 Tax=Legionella yabuuchiae TaxID=376727 RepID=UPI00105634B0|nr:ABC transporter ATP-binding protein [Legionella yabuuchiae]
MIKEEIGSIREVLDHSTVMSIMIISLLASLLSLTIPVAAQTLINLIAFGKLLRPVFTLSIIVFIFMLALGALNVWQIIIAEVIQQKLMVKISLNLTNQYNHLSLSNFSAHHGPELVNRFFEIVTIKKSLANLLIYGINLSLQVFFGLILLLIYHPMFLAFDAIVILGILLVILVPYRKAIESAKKECDEKHNLGAWLEEILINRFLFRFNLYHRFATQQTDKRLVSFLKARNLHFKQLVKHQIGFNLLSALVSSLLLGVGGYLVVNDQLSLGQLAAAEIVLGALIYSFKRFGTLLESFYDMIASESKIESVVNLPVEQVDKNLSEIYVPIQTLEIRNPDKTIAEATPEKPLLVFSANPDRCQIFTRELFGFREETKYQFYVNQTFCSQTHRIAMRQVSMLVAQPEWFAGTIYDNLLLGHKNTPNKKILEELKQFNLLEKVMHQPNGLKTVVYEWKTVFSLYELTQLMIVRALLFKPQLLVIDRALDVFNDEQLDKIMDRLKELEQTILIIVSQKKEFKQITNHWVIPE